MSKEKVFKKSALELRKHLLENKDQVKLDLQKMREMSKEKKVKTVVK